MKILLFAFLVLFSFILLNSAEAFETDQTSYISSKYDPAEIKVSGDIDNYQKGKRFFIELVTPDGFSEEYDVRVTDDNYFSLTIRTGSDWLNGKYTLNANYDGQVIDSTVFEIKPPEDFRSSMVTPAQSEESTKSKDQIVTQQTNSKPTKIPEWVKNIALWYGQGVVSEDDFINAITFLFEKKIIVIDSINSLQNTQQSKPVPQPEPKKQPAPEPPLPEKPTTVTTPQKETDPNIMTNSKFEVVFSNPDKYKGKWAKLDGEITQILRESDGIAFVFSLSDSFDISKRIWLITQNTSLKFKENECYTVEGKILGGNEAQLLFTGATREIPTVQLEKYHPISCLDAKYPALKTYNVNKSQTLGKIKITVHQIQLAEEHTRALVEIENLGNPYGITFYDYTSKIIQNKSQYLADSFPFIDAEYDTINSDIPKNIVEKGYIFYKPIGEGSFKIFFEATEEAESWIDYKEYEFEFSVN